MSVKIAKIFQALNYVIFYRLLSFFFDYEVFGRENLEGLEKKAIIFASNHSGYMDHFFAGGIPPRKKGDLFPSNFYPIRFLAHSRFFSWRYSILSAYLRLSGAIKIYRNTGMDFAVVLKDAMESLKDNQCIWIFPEGGFSDLTPEKISFRKAKKGVAYLHFQTSAPIVPVAIKGAYRALSFSSLLRKNKIKVLIGKPIISLEKTENLEDGAEFVLNEVKKLYYNLPLC